MRQPGETVYPRFWDEKRETADAASRRAAILNRIHHQLHNVYEQLPFYRNLYDAQGFHPDDVKSLDDFTAKVPVITKSMLVADQAANPPFGSYTRDFPSSEIARIHGSSGTSGTPTMYAVSQKDWDRAAEVHAMAQWCAGVRPSDTVQIGFPFGLFFGGWGVLQGAERLGATVFPLGVTDSEKHIEMLLRLGTTVFTATPSYCMHLISVAEGMGIDLRDTAVRLLITGGEPGGSLPGTRQALAAGWGATVVDAGSTSEMYPFQTNVGCETGTGTHLINDEVYAEVVDRDDFTQQLPAGERGAIVYTHLWRESQPMIRFAPGDETYVDEGPCVCGRTYPRMPEGVLGRLDDMLVIRGANIYPSAIENVLREFPELDGEFRINVFRTGTMDEISVDVERSPDDAGAGVTLRDDALIDRVQALLKSRIGIRIPVALVPVGTFEPTTFKARRVVDTREQWV
ncbi:phenylacetate--CoA ligase family protein [Gordonia aurantiaca]|uniref:phenylacetate--CoA ligase family protein n=1 Tax=Gordonia sp. B21 TaxID=3151852 RepID=UPI003267DCAE